MIEIIKHKDWLIVEIDDQKKKETIQLAQIELDQFANLLKEKFENHFERERGTDSRDTSKAVKVKIRDRKGGKLGKSRTIWIDDDTTDSVLQHIQGECKTPEQPQNGYILSLLKK